MVTVLVLKPFRDLKEPDRSRRDRKPGDTFEATEKRFAEISAKLPGYVELAGAAPKIAEPAPEDKAGHGDALNGMTMAQLRALCAERGIVAPARAKKAMLIGLLQE